MSDEDEKRERDRREWLGEPIEHGGGYLPPGRYDPVPEVALRGGCCLFEAAVGVLAALALPVSLLLS